jgi:uncharacterized protein (DUF1697 family)
MHPKIQLSTLSENVGFPLAGPNSRSIPQSLTASSNPSGAVPGRSTVRMNELREAFAAAGCTGVRTFIQSGNVIFDAPAECSAIIFEKIRAAVCDLLGAEPGIFFRSIHEVDSMLQGAPFRGFEMEPGIKLYVAFLSGKPQRKPRLPLFSVKEGLEVIEIKKQEVFIVSRRKKNGFYGFPNNFIEKELRVSATSRNWSTLTKIVGAVRKGPGLTSA